MNEPLEPMDVERVFGEIAGVTPAPESTRRALARVEAALAAEPRRRMRWVLPASIAAAVIVAAGIGLSLLPARASAAEMLATTIKANEEYKGWVHLTYGKDMPRSEHWNTQTHADASYIEGVFMDDPSKADEIPETRITFDNPEAGEISEYFSSTGLIYLATSLPDMRFVNSDQETPLSFPSLIERLRTVAGQDAVKITESTDRGMDRFDIAIAAPATRPDEVYFQKGAGSLGRPSTVWVDPKTKLIRMAQVGGMEMTLTYGAPEIRSIYDVGAPKDARVRDNRAAPETIAAYNRVLARAQKPLPDGVMVSLTTGRRSSQLIVYGRAGAQWASRDYDVASFGGVTAPSKQESGMQVPDHWQDSAADEFFRQLAATIPYIETAGDGTKAWYGEFDKDTGEQFVSYGLVVNDNGTMRNSTGKIPGRKEYTGEEARIRARDCSPTRWFFPYDVGTMFSVTNQLDLITSADRPGEVAFRVRFNDDTPDTLLALSQDWVDAAHDDRPVSFQELSFANGKARQIYSRTVKQFGQYATLPAPDGRSYPTVWTGTTYDAAGNILFGPTVTELRFFPDRLMPEIPKKPLRP